MSSDQDSPDLPNGAQESNSKVLHSNLARTLDQFDQLIPSQDLEGYDDSPKGNLVNRVKSFKPTTALSHINQVFHSHFPNEVKSNALIGSFDNFLKGIIKNINLDGRDKASLGQFDKLLTGFPDNMLKNLGQNSNPDNISKIINMGTTLIKKYEQEIAHNSNLYRGSESYMMKFIAELVDQDMPEAIGRAKNVSKVLNRMESATATLSIFDFARVVEDLAITKGLSPKSKERIDRVEEVIKRSGPEQSLGASPYAKPDRETWNNLRRMGVERRVPVWRDLLMMTRSSEEDHQEYGLLVTNTPEELPILEYLRGAQGQIKNGTETNRYKENVFFHEHPSPHLGRELVSPLVSTGDITATWMSDYGGGYLNVVGVNGVTLHIGSEIVPFSPDSKKPPQSQYTVENGGYKGKQIAPEEWFGGTNNVMGLLQETRAPYIYSIFQGRMKYYFLHLPWEQIDYSVSFNDVCFKDGLSKLLTKIEGVPTSINVQNLNQALELTREVRVG